MRNAEVTQHGREVGHFPPLGAEVSNEWNYPLLPLCFHSVPGTTLTFSIFLRMYPLLITGKTYVVLNCSKNKNYLPPLQVSSQ